MCFVVRGLLDVLEHRPNLGTELAEFEVWHPGRCSVDIGETHQSTGHLTLLHDGQPLFLCRRHGRVEITWFEAHMVQARSAALQEFGIDADAAHRLDQLQLHVARVGHRDVGGEIRGLPVEAAGFRPELDVGQPDP